MVLHIVSYFYTLYVDETTWEIWLQISKLVLGKYVAFALFWNQVGLPVTDKELSDFIKAGGISWPV